MTATRFKTSNYIGIINTLAPELARSRTGHLDAAKLLALRMVIQIGEAAPGAIPFEQVYGLADEDSRAGLLELAGRLQFDEPINIQLTSGTSVFCAAEGPQPAMSHTPADTLAIDRSGSFWTKSATKCASAPIDALRRESLWYQSTVDGGCCPAAKTCRQAGPIVRFSCVRRCPASAAGRRAGQVTADSREA